MTGGRSHNPVTVATAQGIPVALLAQALSANTRPRVRPFDHDIELGTPGPVLRRVNMAAGAGGTFHKCGVDDRRFGPLSPI
ncbi:MAG: hypothetical protein GDA36_12580 [Rhodobacteraceae bacterium]|nr:hypothetical protein [Paracoccaceae bacterium]